MKFTRIPATTFEELQMNAGIMASAFTPGTGTLDDADILGATTGGLTVKAVPEYADMGEDIDNCPKNTKELKKITGWTITASGTLVTTKAATTKKLLAAADVSGNKITPRMDLAAADFGDIWVVGDYSDKNEDGTGATAGFVANNLKNAMNVLGFRWKTNNKDKGDFAFDFQGHYDLEHIDDVPFEIYVRAGTST